VRHEHHDGFDLRGLSQVRRRPTSPSRQCIGSQLVEALASLTIELHNQAITDTIGMCAEQRCAHKHA
jgi:hypothetical protein